MIETKNEQNIEHTSKNNIKNNKLQNRHVVLPCDVCNGVCGCRMLRTHIYGRETTKARMHGWNDEQNKQCEADKTHTST